MKRLNLTETWILCLRMWKWIAEEIKKNPEGDPARLKCQWMKEHDFYVTVDGNIFSDVRCDCFFCEYIDVRELNCYNCPGYKVDKKFHCDNDDYSYYDHPIEFYKKLLALNKIRQKRARK